MTKADKREVAKAVQAESDAAFEKYGPFASTHEAYGVLAEEVAELLAAIHSNKRFAIQREAIQVAAVALRLATQLETCSDAFGDRSGFRGN